jgi:hypothetical protein
VLAFSVVWSIASSKVAVSISPGLTSVASATGTVVLTVGGAEPRFPRNATSIQ